MELSGCAPVLICDTVISSILYAPLARGFFCAGEPERVDKQGKTVFGISTAEAGEKILCKGNHWRDVLFKQGLSTGFQWVT